MKTLISLLSIAFALSCAISQPNYRIEWFRQVDNPILPADSARGLRVGPDGLPIVMGQYAFSSIDQKTYMTVKYTSDGQVVWWRQETPRSTSLPRTLLMSAEGDPIVVGKYSAAGAPYHTQFFAAKYRGSDGAVLWRMLHYLPHVQSNCEVAAADIDEEGNVYLCGKTAATGVVIKIDGQSGQILWVDERYQWPPFASFYHSASAGRRSVAAFGGERINSSLGNVPVARWVDRLTGEYWFERSFNADGTASFGLSLYDRHGWFIAEGGGFYVLPDGSATQLSAWFKYSEIDGHIIWESFPHYPASSEHITFDNISNIFISGVYYNFDINNQQRNAYYKKLSLLTGETIYEHRLAPYDVPSGLVCAAQAPNGLLVAVGARKPHNQRYHALLLAIDSESGRILSTISHPTDGSYTSEFSSVAAAPDGSVYAAGHENIQGRGYILTAKFVPVERGDLDQNGCVDDRDLALLLENFGAESDRYDVDRYGIVDEADLAELLQNFGKGCSQ